MGSGLAGSCLAWQIDQLGLSYRIFNDPNRAAASQTAAGFINPITGKWMTKSWEIDRLLPTAKNFYSTIERQLNCSIHHPLAIRRFFIRPEDAARASRKIKNPRYSPYLEKVLPLGSDVCAIKDSFGSLIIGGGLWLNVPEFLHQLKSYFKKKATLIESALDYAQLSPPDQSGQLTWEYRGLRAKTVVFCQGIHSLENPFFNHLDITPIKGEMLTLELPDLRLQPGLYHKKRWLHALPNANAEVEDICHRFRFGASYAEGVSDRDPSPAAKASLLEILETMTDHPPRILEHKVGIRPSTRDAVPLIAQHPEYPSLYAINGLGSKGTASAPYLAEQLLKKLGYGD